MFPMGVQTRPRNPRRGFVSTSVSAWVNFTPLSLAPSLWLDAADASTITASSGAVSQWDDKSGNAFHVSQATGASQPTTGTSTINGYNALSFDGSNDRLERTTAVQLVNQTTGTFTAFCVARPSSLVGAQGIVSQDSITGTRMPQMLRTLETDLNVLAIVSTNDNDSAGVTLTANTPFTGSSLVRTTTVECFVNGRTNGASALTTSLLTSSANIYIGRIGNDTRFHFPGLIGEVIVYPRPLTGVEHNMVGNYLATKWGTSWRPV